MKTRRQFNTYIAWTTPLIAVVNIPAHAQTSVCSMVDVAGPWEITNSDNSRSPLSLLENGTVGQGGTWTLTGTMVSVSYVGGDSGLNGTINASCNSMSGTVSSIFPESNGNPFTAIKLDIG